MNTLETAIRQDLQRVEELISKVLRAEGRLMREVVEFVLQARGKMLRPKLALLCARAQDPAHPKAAKDCIPIAAALDLIHNATLLHDDVIDRAPLRRGRPTVNAKWGDDVAILMADFMYASAFDLVRLDALRVLTRVTRDMSIGEMFQIETRERWLTVEEYMRIIRSKTALLFGACAGLGAHTGGAPPERVQRFTEFGVAFGMAFQLTDDALDYSAQGEKWGKRVGADLAEGKQTLPLLHALQNAKAEDRKALEACLRNGRDFQTVHRYVARYGGVEQTRAQARQLAAEAIQSLDSAFENGAPSDFAPGEPVQALRKLAESVAEREY